MRKEDDGSLLISRRLKEAKLGARDWLCDPSSFIFILHFFTLPSTFVLECHKVFSPYEITTI
jgi:hypothetical protein